jgi:hypothetical protein
MEDRRKDDRPQQGHKDAPHKGPERRERDKQGSPTKGHDQTARDMGRGKSHDRGRDQTAREMSQPTKQG